jgi:hypothetical protein
MQLEGRKERLINNAWRERAFEQLAAMPVGGLLAYQRTRLIMISAGTIPISS